MLAEGLVSKPDRPKPYAKRVPEGPSGTGGRGTPCAGTLPATLCHDLVSAVNWINELRYDTRLQDPLIKAAVPGPWGRAPARQPPFPWISLSCLAFQKFEPGVRGVAAGPPHASLA